MGYTIKQKIDICWKAESNPQMTQADLALWALKEYGSKKPPSQTTISRILSSKNELLASKETEFKLVRRRKQSNPLLRRILTEWITQATWENIPITTPVIQLTANAIWTRLPTKEKDGNGIFNQKWCNHFLRGLNINLTGTPDDHAQNPGKYPLNKVWKLEDKVELKSYLKQLIHTEGYSPQDIFTIDEFQLFYSLPLDQIFDVSSIDKGLKQNSSTSASSLTIMLGCNIDGSEKLTPLIVGNYDKFEVSKSSNSSLKNISLETISQHTLMNKITETYHLSYKSNTNKWITSSMFQNYLLTLEHKLTNVSPNRKILIILDDSSSHRTINIKFSNIRLCFLKNNTNHKNPYHSSYNGIKFDYLPMNFGIVEEFKILYRIQQYLEMINLQRRKSRRLNDKEELLECELSNDDHPADFNLEYLRNESSSTAMEVLSESDYTIPLIKVIEWIKRAWDSLSSEKIFISWRKTNLIELGPRPGLQFALTLPQPYLHPSLTPIASRCATYETNKSYNTLANIMSHLNVVIPWEIEDLLGLVNERAKITLIYASIEEIIGSCLSD
ncbi:DDE-domain-containing protein, partial [Suhomyces tanzawaensis NRRL Y-17324]